MKSWNLILCLLLLCIWFIFVLSLALNIPKNARKLGVGREQFDAGVNGLRRFLSIALHFPTAHDFHVIRACKWACTLEQQTKFPSS